MRLFVVYLIQILQIEGRANVLEKGCRSVYGSVVDELKRLIEAGVYKSGEKLPSVRALALERGINPNTVQRAYLSLEEEGYVRIYAKKGAFVVLEEKGAGREEEITAILRALKASGVTREMLERAIIKAFEGEQE